MTLVKPDPTALDVQQFVCRQVFSLCKTDAIYTMRFKGRQVDAISADGAKELYRNCVQLFELDLFEQVGLTDDIKKDLWITTVQWRALAPGTLKVVRLFSTMGAEPFEDGNDPFGIVPRKAYGKAVRNANLEMVPLPIRKAFIDYMAKQTGRPLLGDEALLENPVQAPPRPEPKPKRPRETPTEKLRICPEHKQSWGILSTGEVGHSLDDGGWCYKDDPGITSENDEAWNDLTEGAEQGR